jgi:uncharacterized protein
MPVHKRVLTERVLGIFAKEPRPGHVKTRLAASVSDEWAGAVADAFLLDSLDRLSNVEARRVLCYSPVDARAFFEFCSAGRFLATPQAEGDLGARMAAFFAQQFKEGADRVVLVGSDSPTVPVGFIEQAFEMLLAADIVLGPATDGGYYLIGSAGAVPQVFEGISWGTRKVLRETMEMIGRLGHRVSLLPPWYDVDDLEDWRMLQGHLAAMRAAGEDPRVPRTERLAIAPSTESL